jgi:hypothetical protein
MALRGVPKDEPVSSMLIYCTILLHHRRINHVIIPSVPKRLPNVSPAVVIVVDDIFAAQRRDDKRERYSFRIMIMHHANLSFGHCRFSLSSVMRFVCIDGYVVLNGGTGYVDPFLRRGVLYSLVDKTNRPQQQQQQQQPPGMRQGAPLPGQEPYQNRRPILRNTDPYKILLPSRRPVAGTVGGANRTALNTRALPLQQQQPIQNQQYPQHQQPFHPPPFGGQPLQQQQQQHQQWQMQEGYPPPFGGPPLQQQQHPGYPPPFGGHPRQQQQQLSPMQQRQHHQRPHHLQRMQQSLQPQQDQQFSPYQPIHQQTMHSQAYLNVTQSENFDNGYDNNSMYGHNGLLPSQASVSSNHMADVQFPMLPPSPAPPFQGRRRFGGQSVDARFGGEMADGSSAQREWPFSRMEDGGASAGWGASSQQQYVTPSSQFSHQEHMIVNAPWNASSSMSPPPHPAQTQGIDRFKRGRFSTTAGLDASPMQDWSAPPFGGFLQEEQGQSAESLDFDFNKENFLNSGSSPPSLYCPQATCADKFGPSFQPPTAAPLHPQQYQYQSLPPFAAPPPVQEQQSFPQSRSAAFSYTTPCAGWEPNPKDTVFAQDDFPRPSNHLPRSIDGAPLSSVGVPAVADNSDANFDPAGRAPYHQSKQPPPTEVAVGLGTINQHHGMDQQSGQDDSISTKGSLCRPSGIPKFQRRPQQDSSETANTLQPHAQALTWQARATEQGQSSAAVAVANGAMAQRQDRSAEQRDSAAIGRDQQLEQPVSHEVGLAAQANLNGPVESEHKPRAQKTGTMESSPAVPPHDLVGHQDQDQTEEEDHTIHPRERYPSFEAPSYLRFFHGSVEVNIHGQPLSSIMRPNVQQEQQPPAAASLLPPHQNRSSSDDDDDDDLDIGNRTSLWGSPKTKTGG